MGIIGYSDVECRWVGFNGSREGHTRLREGKQPARFKLLDHDTLNLKVINIHHLLERIERELDDIVDVTLHGTIWKVEQRRCDASVRDEMWGR